MRKLTSLVLLVIALGKSIFAQPLSGTKTIPGDYASIQAAVSALNSAGVGSGGVTFNVAAGHTETLTGRILMTATGTSANPIVFQKSGSGANPKITAYTGTVATPSSVADGMWALIGSDYVTIDGIDLSEAATNTTTTTTMEYGYALFKASAGNGCLNNTIKNCVVTLSTINNTIGTAPWHNGSHCIVVANTLHTAAAVLTPTNGGTDATNGTNSGNKFYSNTLIGGNAGIVLIGFAATTGTGPAPNPATFLGDLNNDIGGTSTATGNTIKNYGGAAAATNPATGIFANSQWSLNISYNTINNNDGAGTNHVSTLRGIFMSSSSTGANANCNYNNITTKGGGTTTQLTGIENSFGASTPGGNTININNNTITGDYLTATSGTYQGINCAASYPTTLNVNNNTISNYTHSSATLTGSGQVTGITVSGAIAGFNQNIKDNTISDFIRNGTTGGTLIGILSSGTGVPTMGLNVEGNTVTNLQLNGTGTSGAIYGIQVATATLLVNNNTVYNLKNNKTTGTGLLYGIYDIASPTNETYSNNTIYDLGHSGTGTVIGLYSSTAAGTKKIFGNKIYQISGGGLNVYGIQSAASTPEIYKNKVYDIQSNNSGSAVAAGIYISSITSGTGKVYNNYVGDIKAPSATSTATVPSVRGIWSAVSSAAQTLEVSYNTVFLNASSTGSVFSSAAFMCVGNATATTATMVVRNNIFVNNSTPNGANGYTVGHWRATAANTENYSNLSNNNLWHAGTPGVNNLLYYEPTGGASDQTLSNYKTRFSGEVASVSEIPNWVSTTPADPNYLHINTTTPTQIESGGQVIAGITDDYDGDTRSTVSTDIGADEFNGIGIDNSGPTIVYTNLSTSCGPVDRTLVATISDATGVPTSGANLPRIYYKQSTGSTWYSQQGSLTSGTPQNGTWSFNIIAADMTGLTAGSIVQYFIIAQDEVGSGANISSNPGGAVASDVNTITTYPSAPAQYTVQGSISGTYTVGAGGNYASLTAAVNDFNTKCISGPVVFELISSNYSSGETFPISINNNINSSATNTLTIRPAAGVSPVITGSVATGAILKLNGADYVTIDGSNNGTNSRNLTIINSVASGTGNAVIWIASTAVGDGANNNTIKNTIIEGAAMTSGASAFSGVHVGGATTIGLTTAGFERNNNTTIENNLFRKTQYGLTMFGWSATAPDLNTKVVNNNFGTATAGDGFYQSAVVADRQTNMEISGNEIQNIVHGGTGASAVYGLRLLDFKNGKAYNNKIHDLSAPSTSTPKVYGIAVSSSTFTTVSNPSNAEVYNNMVWNLSCTGTSTVWNITGIAASVGYGDKFHHNTVHLDDQLSNSSVGLSAGFSIGDGTVTGVPGAIEVRNNIVSVTGTNGNTGAANYWAFYSTATNPANYVINNNNWYCVPATSTTTGNIARFNGVNYTTLAAWQAGQPTFDAASVSILPAYVSANDLHLQPISTNLPVNNSAAPIAAITTDIDGDPRSATTPDMGADEFAIPTGANLSMNALINPSAGTVCYSNNQLVTVRIKNESITPHDFATNNALVTVNVTGQTTATLTATVNTGTLASGATLDVDLTPTLDMSAVGTYTFNADVAITGDINPSNNVLSPAVNRTNNTLSGNYTVGAGGNFATLTAAVAAYNTACLGGSVTFSLTDATYSTAETFPIVISQNSSASAVNTLTIKPAVSNTATITGAVPSGALIKLDNADYVTIDGSNNGTNTRNLNINNTATSAPSGVWLASGTTTGVTKVTLKNTNIDLSAATGSTSYGVAISGTLISSGGVDNDDVTIENNSIISRNYGVFALATATNKFDNLIIKGNNLATPSTNSLTPVLGVSVSQTTNAQIVENTMAGTTSGSTAPVGFAVQDGASGTQVLRNKITLLTTTSTGGYAGRGITVGGSSATTSATNTTIANNFVAGVGGSNFTSFANSSTMGIAVGVAGQITNISYWADDVNIYNNTVNNVGTHLGITSGSAKITAALFVSANSTNVKVRNNIFIDSIDFVSSVTTTTDESVGIFAAGTTAASFTAVENNIIYVPMGAQGILGNIGGTSATTGTDYTTVTAFNAAFNATGTINGPVRFVSATDLHLNTSAEICNAVDNGVTIATVTNDIDLENRIGQFDIGADELSNNYVPAVAGEVGGATVTENAAVGAARLYKQNGSCNVIAYVVPSGSNPISGNIEAKIKAESGALLSTTRNLPYARRHIDLEPATGAETGTATITLYFTQADFTDYNNFVTSNAIAVPLLPTGPSDAAGISNLLISQFHGTGTSPDNYTGYPSNPNKKEEVINPNDANIVYDAATGIWSVTFNITGFSGFFVHTNQTGLSVGLTNVHGAITGNTNTLYWTTQTEVNNRKFVVERSATGNAYTPIGEVATLAVNGNSSTPIHYSFVDVNPLKGKAHYRLKMVDNGGRESYSPIVTLRRGGGVMEITNVRPNPTTGTVFFNIIGATSNINIAVRTMDGKQVIRKGLVQSGNFSVDLSALAPGMYLLEAIDVRTQEKAVFKIMKH